MLVSDTLNDVREFLNDQSKDRYSDAYLLKLYNEGLLDISKRLKLFKSEASIPLTRGQAVYSLPLDFIEFDDISINDGIPIDFISRQDLITKVGKNWRKTETQALPTNIVYNKQTFYQFRTYPIPVGTNLNELYNIDLYGFVSDVEDIIFIDTFGLPPILEELSSSQLFDPTRVNSDIDQLSSQVTFLAGQVSQYSQSISANAVAIQQVYGIASSAQTTAATAQLAASNAVTTVNDLEITITTLSTDVGTLETTIDNLASQVTTISSQVTSAQNTANAAGTAASAAQATANSAVTTSNTAISRLNNVDGANKTIETLATNVTTLTSTANTALTNANAAGTLAGTANNTANSSLSVANSVKSRIDSISGGPSLETLASNVTTLTASVATANATASSAVTVANNVNARVTNIGGGSGPSIEALATSVTTLSSTVGSNSATLTVHASAIAALQSTTASWEVVTNVNSLTNGFGIYNNGSTEKVVFRTDHLEVYPTTGNTGALVFAVEGGRVVIPNLAITNIIQSANFVSGTSGWMIRKSDGYAEFANVRVRGDVQATSLNAATGTFSGTLTAAAVNAVNTINLADQSVVIDVMSYDANDTAWNYTQTGTTIATKSITMANATANSTIGISCSFRLLSGVTANGASPGIVTFRVVRDGTTILTCSKPVDFRTAAGSTTLGETFDTQILIDFMDQPGAGTFNYQIQYVSQGLYTNSSVYTLVAREKFLRISGGKK